MGRDGKFKILRFKGLFRVSCASLLLPPVAALWHWNARLAAAAAARKRFAGAGGNAAATAAAAQACASSSEALQQYVIRMQQLMSDILLFLQRRAAAGVRGELLEKYSDYEFKFQRFTISLSSIRLGFLNSMDSKFSVGLAPEGLRCNA